MSKHILHLAESVILGEELSHESIVEILKACAIQYFNEDHYQLELTTIDGQFHAGINLNSLDEFLIHQSGAIDSITMSKPRNQSSENQFSLAIYIGEVEKRKEVSFTVMTESEEKSNELQGFLIDHIGKQKEQFESQTAHSYNRNFWFDTKISANQIVNTLEKIMDTFPNRHELITHILTRKNDVLIFKQDELVIAKNVLRKGDQLWVSFYLNGHSGSYLKLQLSFITNLGGFGNLKILSGDSDLNQKIETEVLTAMELDAAADAKLKRALAKHPSLYEVIELSDHKSAERILHSVNKIGTPILESQLLRVVHYQAPFGEQAGPINIGPTDSNLDQFRAQKSGILWCFKIQKPEYRFYLLFHFQSTGPSTLFVYLSLRSDRENMKTLEVIRRAFGKGSSEESRQVANSLQEAFSFDPNLQFQELEEFLTTLGEQFLEGEILKTRVSLLDGESRYYYGLDFPTLEKALNGKNLESVHISMKEASGKHFSIHLHFTQKVDGNNGFYSIALDKPEDNLKAKAFVLKGLKAESALSNRRKQQQASNQPNLQEDTFSFDHSLPVQALMETIDEINQVFLPDKKMSIRIMTKTQEEFYLLDNELAKVEKLLHKDLVSFIYFQKGQSHKQKLSLYLQFHKQGGESGYYSIQGKNEENSQALRDLILRSLGDQKAVRSIFALKAEAGSFHFPENLSADQLIVFLNTLARKFFTREQFIQNRRFNFNVKDSKGKGYNNLSSTEFHNLFTVNRNIFFQLSISVLARSGKFVELLLFFDPSRDGLPGEYNLQLGGKNRNEAIGSFIQSYFGPPPGFELKPIEEKIANQEGEPSTEVTEKETKNPDSKLEEKEKSPQEEEEIDILETPELELPDTVEEIPTSKKFLFVQSEAELTKTNAFLIEYITEQGWETQALPSLETVNALESIRESLSQTDYLIADLHQADPRVFLAIGMAIQQDKDLLLLYQQVDELPLSFKPHEKILYSLSKKGKVRFKAELDYHLKPKHEA